MEAFWADNWIIFRHISMAIAWILFFIGPGIVTLILNR
jgi:hypothetical protein